MQILITGRGIELTEAIKSYTDKKFAGLEKFLEGIIRADVTLGLESHHHQKGDIFFVECKLEVPGPDILVKKTEADLYKAIDKTADHLYEDLKKRKAAAKSLARAKRVVKRDLKEYQP